ncbi:MAG: hypothetical protein ACK4M9_16680 [Anaerobacillus sp.]|uniref:hypothetical protein n=1 Tax=Anaerobacillus sp. TaxID=1872506 RepID=UPI00391B0AC3
MKRKTFFILFGSTLLFIGLIIWYRLPKELNNTYEGVLFNLGTENSATEKIVNVELNGKVQRSLFGYKTYKGTIVIDGEVIPPLTARYAEVEFKVGSGYSNGNTIQFIDDDLDGNYIFGTIYISDDLSALTIAINEQLELGGSQWDSGDGLVLSAPATTRKAALNITNELMKHQSLDPFE